MRTRTTSKTDPAIPTHLDGFGVTGTCTNPITVTWPNSAYSENSSYVPYEMTKVMHDVVTPDFYRQSADGVIINNPFDYVLTEWYRDKVSWYTSMFDCITTTCSGKPTTVINSGARRVGTRSPVTIFGASPAFLPAPSLDVDRVKNLAITDAFSKVGDQTAQSLVILAEGEKTIKSFVDIFTRLIRIGRALRKWDVGYLRKQLSAKELSNRWMEGRYAIRPVVYDMCDVVKALKKRGVARPLRQTSRGGFNDQSTVDQSGVLVYTGFATSYKALKVTQRIISARSGVLTAINKISEATIWGLDRPFEAMWELVPFSFVVDWFFNVGKTIAAWTPKWGLSSLASWVTVHDIVSQSIFTDTVSSTYVAPHTAYENICNVTGGFITKVVKTVNRYPNPNQPILPTYNVRLDAAKLIDLAIWGKRLFGR